MSKKNKIIMGVLIVCLLGVVGHVKLNFSNGYKISIVNNTDKTVANLELKYKVGNTIQIVSQIEPKESWKKKIDTNSIQGENAILLTYKDNKGNSYEECVVGYLEKGYNGQANVSINKIDENGKLEIDVK